MISFSVTEQLARASARRPLVVVGLWVALFCIGAFLATGIQDVLTTEFTVTNEPDSVKADELLAERLRGPAQDRELVIVGSASATVADPEFRSFVDDLLAKIRGLGGVVQGATSFYETGDESLVSADHHKTLLPVAIAGNPYEASSHLGSLTDLVDEANAGDQFEVMTAGMGSIDRAFTETSEQDLQRGELIGIPIALIVLVLVFGAAVAASLPLMLAVLAIVVSVGAVTLIGQAFELNFLVLNIMTMVGLAVGIDYSLFIVHRYREERKRGLAKHEAITRAGATASRAVLFSGGTVVVGLLGLFIVPTNIYRSQAVGAITVVVFTVLAALTLLPAVLSLLGDRVDALRLPLLQRGRSPEDEGGFWGRVTSVVTAHPLISAVGAAAILVAAAVPLFTIDSAIAVVGTLPQDAEARRAFETLGSDFSAGLISPAEIVVKAPDVNTPAVQEAIDGLLETLDADEGFGAARSETDEAGDLALLSVPITGGPEGDAAQDAIRRLRNDYIPAAFAGTDTEVLVTGTTAHYEDLFSVILTYTPMVFAFVLGLSFVLLLIVFRSLVVPVKALIMNLLSVGAAYGLLVLVFQHGVGNEIFGFQHTGTIQVWLPVLLFAYLFGLSMDYHVFLLSRIRERFDQTRDNAGSVAFGVRRTAGIITGAALIMVAVFAGLAMGDLVPLQQVGFGLAVGVLLDATIVRSVLVPATMQLLGDLNWYLPKWLHWLPDIRVEGTPGRGN
jgi:RND superfamily putative drug exporter